MTYTCRLANTPELMEKVFRLRYECYLRKGAIEPRADQRFADPFDNEPNQFSFLIEDASGEAAASIRISVVRPDLNWVTSPSARVFGDDRVYQSLYREGGFVEASRLCFGETARRDVLYRLMANLVAVGDQFGVEWLVACPRVEHSEMYQRSFGFRPLAAPRQYLGVRFQTDLLGTRREELREVAGRWRPMSAAWAEARRYVASVFGCVGGCPETALHQVVHIG